MLPLLLLACQPVDLPESEPLPFDSGTPPGPTDSGTTVPAEVCNGLDDDGDGRIDEDFGDRDADGVADCVDAACTPDAPAPRSETRADCGPTTPGPAPVDPWSVGVEWRYVGGNVLSTPVVGDLDGDAVAEVVIVEEVGESGQGVILDGASGAVEQILGEADPWSPAALGDVDGDGAPDIVTTRGACFDPHTVDAWDAGGALLWSTDVGSQCATAPLLVDLEGDGTVEVIVGEYVLDGGSGAVERVLPLSSPGENWGAPAAADLDLDGDQEILLANQVFDTDGRLWWTCGRGGTGAFPQPVNVDDDAAGEVLVAGNGQLTLCDDDGTERWTWTYPGYGSAIAVADFNGDDLPDFAYARSGFVTLAQIDGSARWSTPVADALGLAGCTSWDLDDDGVPEVVYADEQDLLVLDGRTGEVRVRETGHDSRTAAETPAVADVDGDGHGEIVVPSDGGDTPGVAVIGAAAGDWPWARPVYHQATYSGVGVTDTLTILPYTTAPWEMSAGVFRGQPSARTRGGRPNARLSLSGMCVSSCEAVGVVEIWVELWNDGGEPLDPVAVEVWGDPDGAPTLLDRRVSPPVPVGGSTAWLVTGPAQAVGAAIEAVADPTEATTECEEADNRARWTDTPCP